MIDGFAIALEAAGSGDKTETEGYNADGQTAGDSPPSRLIATPVR